MDEYERRITEKLRRELGPQIVQWLEDPTVIEIMLNPDGNLWVERLGEPMERVGTMRASAAESLMGTVASKLRISITAQQPILECELPLDGSRFEALLPPVVKGPTFTIRKKAVAVYTLDDYVERGIMSRVQADTIRAAVESRSNMLIVGGTGSGKTTLMNAILAYMTAIAPELRVVLLEDTEELQCTAPNVVPLRAVDQIDMTRLLKGTMRLRPDVIHVGEVRDGAALALLKAWNTGHPGGLATVHANSAAAGLIRLEQLVAEATQAPLQSLIAEAIDLVIAIERVTSTNQRVKGEKTGSSLKVKEIISVDGYADGSYLFNAVC